MMILKGLYDATNKRLMINFSCSLLREYYDILDGVVVKYKKAGYLPSDIELQRIEDTVALMTIPIEVPGADNLKNGDKVTGIPKDLLEKLTSVLDNFKNLALEKELKTTEFIPLSGYSLKDLQTDIIEAIKNRRNFCLIDKFSDYQKFSRHETTKLRQYKVMYPTNDYSEVAISIYQGNLKELRSQYLDKLEEVDWE